MAVDAPAIVKSMDSPENMRVSADPLPPTATATDSLEEAAQKLIRNCFHVSPADPDPDLLRRELEAVITSVLDALSGSSPTPAVSSEPSRLRLLRVLRLLRSAVLQDWSHNDGSLLPTMRAFETVQDLLLDEGETAAAAEVMSPFSRNLLREVAHLLRSPLGSMVLLSGTLLEEQVGPLTEAQRKQLGILHRAAIGAASTTGDLLTLWNERELTESFTAFSVSQTIDRVADILRPVTESRRCKLLAEGAVGDPRTGPAVAVGRVLLGLGLRAALGTQDGTVAVRATADDVDRVGFSVDAEEGWATRNEDVADPGRVFLVDPDSGNFTLSPQGLGLSAARRIIRALGSDLTVDESRNGSLRMSFRLSLPPVA